MKGMSRLFVCALVVALAGAASASLLWAQAEPDAQIVPFSDPSRPGKIEVELLSGAITVRGENRRDVAICVSSVASKSWRNAAPRVFGLGAESASSPVSVTVSAASADAAIATPAAALNKVAPMRRRRAWVRDSSLVAFMFLIFLISSAALRGRNQRCANPTSGRNAVNEMAD